MEALPLDLKIYLMLVVDEFSSLWSLVRTCHSMNDAFEASKNLILSSVLRRALNEHQLCSAMALHHASGLNLRDYFTIKSFLGRWTPPIKYPKPATSLFNHLSRRQILVEWFCRDFQVNLIPLVTRQGSRQSRYMWPSEVIRIHRALYNFNLYAILFADRIYPTVDYDDQLDMDETREVFLDRLPPWEVEELACIHAYLHKRISELPKKDSISAADGLKSHGPQHPTLHFNIREFLISQGLERLYTLFSATSKYEIERLTCTWSMDPRFLGNVLRVGYSVWNMAAEKPDFSARKAMDDHDGPNAGWLWVHKDRETVLYGRGSVPELRNLGYCMWDGKRMKNWSVFNKPFESKHAYKLLYKKSKSSKKANFRSLVTSEPRSDTLNPKLEDLDLGHPRQV
jgi:hypothetical protein